MPDARLLLSGMHAKPRLRTQQDDTIERPRVEPRMKTILPAGRGGEANSTDPHGALQ